MMDINFSFRFNYGYTDHEVEDFRELLADIPKCECSRLPIPMAYPVEVLLAITVSGILGGIAGGFLQAVGEDLWNVLKAKMQTFFAKRKTSIELSLNFDDCRITLHMTDGQGKTHFELLDVLDKIVVDIQRAFSEKRIPQDSFDLRGIYFSDKDHRWVVQYATDREFTKRYELNWKTGEWEAEHLKRFEEKEDNDNDDD